MPNLNAVDIEKLCDDWLAASTQGGDMVLGAETEKYRLLANGVQFHELDHETLCVTLLSLSKVLLRPGLNTIVDHDHFAAWSWCGQLLLAGRSSVFPIEEREIQSLYEASIHAALVGCRKPPATREEWTEMCRTDALQPHHSKLLLQQSSLVLAYLTFPLLEAVLKRACTAYVAFDGQVVSAFSVPSRQGAPNTKLYGPAGAPGSPKCSSLRDLLFLHQTLVASPNQKALLNRFRAHLNTIDAAQDPFDLIYSWRNQSLHGSTNFQTIGGTMLSLALLISLFEIEQNFEERRLKTVDICRWEAQSPTRSPWSFYPPY
jgi:hypothetical protein